jgi:predicted esterase
MRFSSCLCLALALTGCKRKAEPAQDQLLRTGENRHAGMNLVPFSPSKVQKIVAIDPPGHDITIIALHGMGGRAGDFKALERHLTSHFRKHAKVVLLDHAGGSWFSFNTYDPIEMQKRVMAGQEIVDMESLNKARDYVSMTMRMEAAELKGDFSKIFLVGFSQGGMLAAWTALTVSDKFGGALVLSGGVPVVDLSQVKGVCKKTPILHLHGLMDNKVPYQFAAKGAANVVGIGCGPYSLRSIPMLGHEMDPDELKQIQDWIDKRV